VLVAVATDFAFELDRARTIDGGLPSLLFDDAFIEEDGPFFSSLSIPFLDGGDDDDDDVVAADNGNKLVLRSSFKAASTVEIRGCHSKSNLWRDIQLSNRSID
jgi:hypothetical protein